jgi:hypothetical protein
MKLFYLTLLWSGEEKCQEVPNIFFTVNILRAEQTFVKLSSCLCYYDLAVNFEAIRKGTTTK